MLTTWTRPSSGSQTLPSGLFALVERPSGYGGTAYALSADLDPESRFYPQGTVVSRCRRELGLWIVLREP
jgi:hypothetical protein